MKKNILLIEDKPSQLRLAEYKLPFKMDYVSFSTITPQILASRTINHLMQPDVILIDLSGNDTYSLDILKTLKIHHPEWPVVIMVPYGAEKLGMEAVNLGGSDFICKPVSIERLILTLQNILKIQSMSEEIARLERHNYHQVSFKDIGGESVAVKQALAKAEMAALSDAPLWICGEEGTGKELLARAIHGSGNRRGKPFIAIECSTLVDDELQLFTRKAHEVQEGTLYLKHIESLPESLRNAMLQMLQTSKSGSTDAPRVFPTQCRFIVGSNTSVKNAVAPTGGNTISDSWNGLLINLPPLRERKEDIEALAKHLIAIHAASENKSIPTLSTDALKSLMSNEWPGNINQLSKTLQRAVLLCNHSEMDAGTLRLIQQLEPVNYFRQHNGSKLTPIPSWLDTHGQVRKLKCIEEEVIRFALAHAGGSMTRAAKSLGIGRSTLYRKLEEMDIGMGAYKA